jgi:TM2 domain-containing membrane protein YozV
MDCVNHTGVTATAFCQNCGKALCATCVRNAPGGQVLCEPCFTAWQGMQAPFVAPPPGAPNPVAAGILGLIPGVGAMYNGQFLKGLIHVIIFAVLVTGASQFHGGLDVFFGLMIPAWILYQAFEAYHTAAARRDGLPAPDPLGINELSNLFTPGGRPPFAGPTATPGAPPPQGTASGPAAGYTPPAANPYSTGFTPVSGYVGPAVPPVPPVPPVYWRRKEPIGAVILIGFGLILLLNQLGVVTEHIVHFLWPLLFIGLGAWLIYRRMNDTSGGC